MKKYIIKGIMIFSVLYSCYDSDDTLTLTIENTLPSVANLTVSGNLTASSTLTATYTFNDADGDSENESIYQWYTAESTDGNNKQVISGATSKTYTLTTNDLNQYVGFEVTPHDGIDYGEKKRSSLFGPIKPEGSNTLPSATDLTVSGNLTASSTLTATYTFNDADGDSENESIYQWYTAENSDGSNKQVISGATSKTYTLTTNDLNQYVGFEVTPHDGIGYGEKKLSSFSGPVKSKDTTNLTGQELLDYLKVQYAPPSAGADLYDYDEARDIMYSKIWLQNTNQLSGIYSDYTITMDLTKDPSSDAYNKDINTEHIYPQSRGADNEPMRSDMHHLAPTKSNVNSSRGNLPFGNISDSKATKWYQNANQYNSDPDGSAGDSEAYSKRNSSYFEPRDEVKGDVARAVMYFYTMYDSADTSFFESMKVTLLEWHKLDPVDDFERSRNELIKKYQGNENPYIIDEQFAERAFSN